MTAELLHSNSSRIIVFFNNGPDIDPAREHTGRDEVCLILPIKATALNCVVVLCRYGVREILYLAEEDKRDWEKLK